MPKKQRVTEQLDLFLKLAHPQPHAQLKTTFKRLSRSLAGMGFAHEATIDLVVWEKQLPPTEEIIKIKNAVRDCFETLAKGGVRRENGDPLSGVSGVVAATLPLTEFSILTGLSGISSKAKIYLDGNLSSNTEVYVSILLLLIFMADRPVRYCDACDCLFFPNDKRQLVCSHACRQKKFRINKVISGP